MTLPFYIKHPEVFKLETRVASIEIEQDAALLVFEQTPFYPQGGGQPADRGHIIDEDGSVYPVVSVKLLPDGRIVHRIKSSDPVFAPQDCLQLIVDAEARLLHSRLHTAGELICAAMNTIGCHTWTVTNACHFPGECRVIFDNNSDEVNLQLLSDQLPASLDSMIHENFPVSEFYAHTQDEIAVRYKFGFDKVFGDWPVRMISPAPDFWRPCLGTHVKNLSSIGAVRVRKMNRRKGLILVGYEL
jgi:Ser-tRNA(Ala) deacylase AlaX